MGKVCANCGSQIEDSVNFCTKCGTKILENSQMPMGNGNIVINNIVNTRNDNVKKIGFLTVLGYIVGIPLAISSIGFIVKGNIIGGILYLIASLCVLPFVNELLEKKFNFKLSKILRIILFIILISVATPFINTSNKATSSKSISGDNQVVVETINVKDVINVDDWIIEIEDAKLVEKWSIDVGNRYYSPSYTAEEGKIYILTKLSVKNNSNATKSFSSRVLETNAVCNTDYKYLMSIRNDDEFDYSSVYSIEPLETKKFYIYKDVPKEAVTTSAVVKYKVADKEYDLKIKGGTLNEE